MTKEDKQQLGQEAESVLDFKDAKEMTIGQANRKAEEIEAGVKETDNVLDKYIKQHREEIEAHKFDTIVMQKEMLAEAEEAATVEATESIPNEEPATEVSQQKQLKKRLHLLAFQIQFLGNALQKLSLVQSQQNHMWMKKLRFLKNRKKAGSNQFCFQF